MQRAVINLVKAGLLIFATLGMSTLACAEEETAWMGGLKKKYFGERAIEESNGIIELTAPYRAEDPALVPISVAAKIPQAPDKYIKSVTLVIDNNPTPFAAAFTFTPESGKADVALQIGRAHV